MSKEQYKQKTISVEIGDVLFDPIVLEGMSSIPQDNLKNTLLNSASPIFEELENIYRSGKDLTDDQRSDLKTKIASLLAPYKVNLKDFEDITKDTGGYSSGADTHYCFLYQALHNNRSIQEIIDGYKITDKIGKKIIKTGLKERYHEQFCRDFVTGMSHKVINQNGEIKHENLNKFIRSKVTKDESGRTEEAYNQAERRYKEQVLAEFRSAISMTDAQFKYLEGLHVQTADAGLATMFSKPLLSDNTMKLSSSLREQEIILNVKEENGKLVLLGVKHKAIAGHLIEDLSGNPLFVEDAMVEVDVDLSHLTGNKKEGEKEFLPLPSQKVRKIVTYTPLHEEAEYSLPECLEYRAVDNILTTAIKEQDHAKINKIMNTAPAEVVDNILTTAIKEQDHAKINKIMNAAPAEVVDKFITNFIKQQIEEGKEAGDSAEIIQKGILRKLVGGGSLRQESSPELNEKIELYIKHETPDRLTKIVQFVKALVRSAAQAKWISGEEYQKQRLEKEAGAIKDVLKKMFKKNTLSN